jgi:hypothetical protein
VEFRDTAAPQLKASSIKVVRSAYSSCPVRRLSQKTLKVSRPRDFKNLLNFGAILQNRLPCDNEQKTRNRKKRRL